MRTQRHGHQGGTWSHKEECSKSHTKRDGHLELCKQRIIWTCPPCLCTWRWLEQASSTWPTPSFWVWPHTGCLVDRCRERCGHGIPFPCHSFSLSSVSSRLGCDLGWSRHDEGWIFTRGPAGNAFLPAHLLSDEVGEGSTLDVFVGKEGVVAIGMEASLTPCLGNPATGVSVSVNIIAKKRRRWRVPGIGQIIWLSCSNPSTFLVQTCGQRSSMPVDSKCEATGFFLHLCRIIKFLVSF